MTFAGITTRDVLALAVVGASIVFNGVSLWFGKELDPTTIGFTGMVLGYYFRTPEGAAAVNAEPLAAPVTGDDNG